MNPKRKLPLFILGMIFIDFVCFAQTEIKANPDLFSTAISWTTQGIPQINIGDVLPFRYFTIGGMFEARNEKRFNQEILPNHNWRGVGKFEIPFSIPAADTSHLSFSAHVMHESAHPTMGIREPTQNAYDLIYDDNYRRMILNSIGLTSAIRYYFPRTYLTANVTYYFYCMSKNTPELSGSKLGISNGLSCGIENQWVVKPGINFNISCYDRLILQGFETDTGFVYEGNGMSLIKVNKPYPVIANVNTVVLKVKCNVINGTGRVYGPYCRILFGNSYGFIDSRDTRFVVSIGIETSL